MFDLSTLKDGDYFDAPVAFINNSEGMRAIDPVWALALGQLMQARGQNQPVAVRRVGDGLKTVWGHHRIEGRRLTDQPTVKAVLFAGSGLDIAEAQISENLFKKGLAPLDRAAQVADLIDIQKARMGVKADASAQSVAANARWSDRIGAEADDACARIAHAFGFADEVGERAGLSRRAIYLDLELHRGIRGDVAEALRDQPIAQNASQLRALAKLPESDQREVAGMIVEGAAKGVSDAMAALKQKPVKSPAQKAEAALMGNWGRVGDRERKAFLRHICEVGRLPAGVTITIDSETFGGAK